MRLRGNAKGHIRRPHVLLESFVQFPEWTQLLKRVVGRKDAILCLCHSISLHRVIQARVPGVDAAAGARGQPRAHHTLRPAGVHRPRRDRYRIMGVPQQGGARSRLRLQVFRYTASCVSFTTALLCGTCLPLCAAALLKAHDRLRYNTAAAAATDRSWLSLPRQLDNAVKA